MAPGADKRIEFSPAGGLGLVDRGARFLIRFDEVDDATRPQDETRACNDFDVLATGIRVDMPAVVPAALGRGRAFSATTGLSAKDIEPGATLMTRDMSIQVVLSWDAAAQALGQPGEIICRGTGTGPAEYVAYSLQLDVSDAPSFTARLRWHWQDIGGGDHTAPGVLVVLQPGQYTMLTATRRWVSPTQVELAYYIGDQLAGVETSTHGSIGGGTTGTMQIGFRAQGTNSNFLEGVIDEMMLVDRELCAEEVEATWLRITRYQPLGVQLFRESFDRDFPISDLPESDVLLDIRMTGHILGYAAAQTENLRANFLPQRAYGSTLEQWEQAVAVSPKPVQGTQARRERVLARLRQRGGVSIDGIKDALAELVDCLPDDLEFVAYTNTVVDGFDTVLDALLWDMTPTGFASWHAGQARMAPGAGTFLLDDNHRDWRTIAQSVSQPSIHGAVGLEHAIAKLVISTPQNNFEAGVWFGDKGHGNYLLLGLRQDGVFKIVTESFVAGVSQGVVVQATPGANPAAIWFHLYETALGSWTAAWSTVSALGPYTLSGAIAHPTAVHWAGMYIRSIAATGAAVADFDDFQLWTPNGTRPFNAYVYRNPALGGTPDMEGAHSVIQAIKHAFVHATIIDSKRFVLGPNGGRLGRGPLGGL